GMLEKLYIDFMCQAYRLLYEVETRLRLLIDTNLTREYGPIWTRLQKVTSINFHTATYIQLIHIIKQNDALKSIFSKSEIKELTDLNQIRNKICHMRDLTE